MIGKRPRPDLIAVAGLAAVGMALFSPHLLGQTIFIGDSDRLNTFLNIRKLEVESLRTGELPAWSEAQFMGLSTLGLPYMLPDPMSALTALFPLSGFLRVAGVISCGLVILAAWAAYLLLRHIVADRFAAFVGAALFPMSTFGILRIAQVDSAFFIFIALPLGLLLVSRLDERRGVEWRFVALTALLAGLLTFSFLQEVAYAALLLAAFAVYRTVTTRRWRPGVVFGAAVVVAAVVAAPRLLTVLEDLRQLDRGRVPWGANRRELLRILHDGIFGRYHEEARQFANGINLHEGLLLYTSTFAGLLVVVGLIRFRGRWLRLFRERESDRAFYAWCPPVVLAAILTPWGQSLVEWVFLKAGFLHARLSLVAVLPLCVLVATVLAEVRRDAVAPQPRVGPWLILPAMGAAVGGWLSFGDRTLGALTAALGLRPVEIGDRLTLLPLELTRLGVAVAVFVPLMLGVAASRPRPELRFALTATLGVLIVGHALSYAWFKINGDYTRSFPVPFRQGNFFSVAPPHVRLPSESAVRAFHERLDVGRFRTALICDPRVYAAFCAPHVAPFWRLRAVDGYVPGVPARLAGLPWPAGVRTLRAISFPTTDHLPWPLLGLLNVKYAVSVNESLYFNVAPAGSRDRQEAHPDDVEVRANPAPVAPRAFIAEEAVPVVGAPEAARRIRESYAMTAPLNPTQRVFVEGLGSPLVTSARGPVTARYEHDRVEVQLLPAAEPRLLVLNELYHPRWKAVAGSTEVPVLPTNLVMRGVVVPAGVARVEFRFVPFIGTDAAKAVVAGGACLAAGGWWALRGRKQA